MTRLPFWTRSCLPLMLLLLSACAKQAAPAPAPQALPVQTETIAAAAVPQYDEYVSTIKSRRSATINPQVDGNLVKIYVRSGDRVRTGQLLMEIDPAKQEATVSSSRATEQQKLAVFEYNQIEVQRQRKLFEQGVTSRDAFDQAEQAYKNSEAGTRTPPPSRLPRASRSSSATTTSRLRSTASWATFQCTWVTMSRLPPCPPRWMKTATWKPTSSFPRSA